MRWRRCWYFYDGPVWRRLRFAFWIIAAVCFALGAVLAVAHGEAVIGLAILGGMAWGLARPRARL